jgi:DNA mismatch repair ATPase MutS
MTQFCDQNEKWSTYSAFCQKLRSIIRQLSHFQETNLQHISLLLWDTKTYTNLGYILKAYYVVTTDTLFRELFAECIGFYAHINVLRAIYEKSIQGSVHSVEFEDSESGNHLSFKEQYYSPHSTKGHSTVSNDVHLVNKNMILTGPNASGKTTILKSVTVNIILSQQFGYANCQGGKIRPYKFIHSYLNIPDTSGRDSLFQAESRRCKTIIDSIQENNKDRHFCIFDELYSGTNPEEASRAAISYISYLRKFSNVTFMLTTHYHNICDCANTQEKESVPVSNYHMNVVNENNVYTNTYQLLEGISMDRNGTYQIFADLHYPSSILQSLLELYKETKEKKAVTN